jgi:hypothetical protein
LGRAIAKNVKGKIGLGLGVSASGKVGPLKVSGSLGQVTPFGASANLSGSEAYGYATYAGPKLEVDVGRVRVGAAFKEAESRYGGTEGGGRDYVRPGFFGITGVRAAAPNPAELPIPSSISSVDLSVKAVLIDISVSVDPIKAFQDYLSE